MRAPRRLGPLVSAATLLAACSGSTTVSSLPPPLSTATPTAVEAPAPPPPPTTEPAPTVQPSRPESDDRRRRQRVPAIPTPGAPSVVDDLGTIRFWTYLAYQLPDNLGIEDVTYVFEPDGDVLRINNNGNIFNTAADYTRFSIGPEGYVQVVQQLSALGELGRSSYDVGNSRAVAFQAERSFMVGGMRTLDVDDSQLPADEIEIRDAYRRVLEMFEDWSWLVNTSATEPKPWVPPLLGIEVRNEYDTRYYSTPDFEWPFAATKDQVAAIEPGGAASFCLRGADARLAWATFMTSGANNARLPISIIGVDGEVQQREAGLRILYPLYNPSGSACPDIEDL